MNRSTHLLQFSLLLMMIGCGNPTSHEPESGMVNTEVAGSTSEVSEPRLGDADELKLSATELAKAFVEDKSTATTKYEDQWVELTGRINGTSGLGVGDGLTLSGSNLGEGDFFSSMIDCKLADGQIEKVKDISMTQEITLKGQICPSNLVVAALANCEIVHIGKDPAIEVAAADITKEYYDDKSAAHAKYRDKPVQVTGEIAGFDPHEFEIHLKGHQPEGQDAMLVLLRMGAEFNDVKDTVSVGDMVVAKGVGSTFLDNELELTHGHMLEEQ